MNIHYDAKIKVSYPAYRCSCGAVSYAKRNLRHYQGCAFSGAEGFDMYIGPRCVERITSQYQQHGDKTKKWYGISFNMIQERWPWLDIVAQFAPS